MANEEQLSILKQGVEVWNKWRTTSHDVAIDLSKADLSDLKLRQVKLTGADLSGANLSKAYLPGAKLNNANLMHADLSLANLSFADLRGSDFELAKLRQSNLVEANLDEANLRQTDLREASLSGTNLRGAKLKGSDFAQARLIYTSLINIDLSNTIGLEHVQHLGPSSISTDTFVLSNGKIPEIFLRGCGLNDWEISHVKLYNPDLSNEEVNSIQYKIYDLRAIQALQISPLFISYSHGDSIFVDKLESQLNTKGIRFWRDIHDMKAGRIETQIDRAISQNRTVLLVLSENSIKSDWVEHEVRMARGLEKDMGCDVLCPIALDDSWKSSPWPKRVMEQIMEYNILDFSAWEDDIKFEGMFRKLIDGLELFYKG